MDQLASENEEILTIDEIRRRHDGEWLLIEILDTNVDLGKAPGRLLALGATQRAMFRAERKVRKHHPKAALAILGGGEGYSDGEVLRRMLRRFKETGEWVSVNSW